MRVLKGFFQKYGWMYIPGFIFLVINSALDVMPPRILGDAIDAMRVSPIDEKTVWQSILLMLAAAVGIFVTRLIWRFFIVGNARRMERWLRKTLYSHLQILSVDYFNHAKTGDLMAYAVNDINAIRMTFGPALATALISIATGTFSVVSMVQGIHPKLSLFALLPVPFALAAIILLGSETRKRFLKVQKSFANVSERVQENITGIRVIKAYAQEDNEVARFEPLNRAMLDTNVSMVKVSNASGPVVSLAFGISFAISLIYGGNLVRQNVISLGDFVAFNGYLSLIINPVQSLARVTNLVQRGLASLKRYRDVMDVAPEIVDAPVNKHPDPITGEIEARNLSFQYPNDTRTALQGISFNLRRGGTLGIMGRTGSGKSTLGNLLVKIYNPPRGTVFYDGIDIHDISLDVLREKTGFVPQDSFLFSTTIRENIDFYTGSPMADIIEAAKKADIHDSIMSFPDGYDTQVGERGMSLSGGQKQRISIARALLRKPRLYLFDDALSAVDADTEQHILSSMREELRKGASGIIIAHRVSAVMACDEIIVLDEGKIVERGTHDELMRLKGQYYETAMRQAAGQEAAV